MAARKTVTVVFCDIVDSTPLAERIDPEVHRRIQERYFDAVRSALERHGGTVEKFIGDAVMAVFGIPVAHDDDALRAARAASDVRLELSELNERLGRDYGVTIAIRTGVNTGEVVAGDPTHGQAFATGAAVATAQRLEASARAGEILIGDATYRLVSNAALVEPVEPLTLKGMAEPVRAWRLLGVIEGATPFARRLDAPMVGRKPELAALRAEFDAVMRERRCRVATIVGSAGIGKSRLGNELFRVVDGEATTLVGRCLAYGDGITYWPLREIVLGAAGSLSREGIEAALAGAEDAGGVAERLAGVVGTAEVATGGDAPFWAVRRLLEHLARDRPLIIGIDELQWAEPTFLDLVEYLAGWITDAPILIVGLGRPELLEQRPTWPATSSLLLSLDPLSSEEAGQLVEVLGGRAVPADERARILDAAEGNPLFVEQMLALAADESGETRVPPSIQALLAARLDRLAPEERSALECASVIGREFSAGGVSALGDGKAGHSTLLALVRRDLIEPDRPLVPGDDGFRFRHALIRDAAYAAVPKEVRAQLHERYADWLEGVAPELDELLGYHLEQALRYEQELGSENPELAVRAARRLGSAGSRAVSRGDMPAAATLLGRAAALLPNRDPERAGVLAQLGSALMRTGALHDARAAFTEAFDLASDDGDRALALRTRLDLLFCKTFAEPQDSLAETRAITAEVIPELEQLGDDAGLAKAWRLRSDVYLNACLWGKRASALRTALRHARQANDPPEVASAAMALATALYYGPSPVEEAVRECERLLAETPENKALEAALTGVLGGLEAMRGDDERARQLWDRSRSLSDELGQRFRRAGLALFAADIELLSGRPEEAAAVLRWSTARLEEMGVLSTMSTHAAVLADVLCVVGEHEDAERFSRLSEEHAGVDDVFSQAFWRIGRARALAARGRGDEAATLAREAVDLAESTDSPDLRARAALGLAEVTGDEALLRRAHDLYAAKGNVAAIARLGAATAGSS